MAGFDTEYTDGAVCPYCGYEHRDSYDMEEGVNSCASCDNEFEVARHIKITYSTEKIKLRKIMGA